MSRFRRTGLATATAVVASLGLTAIPTAAAETVTITPNPWYASEPFEGWGTSLVWFANATGAYPEELREELYQTVFGEDGLRLNIARYNIGGGNASDVEDYLRPGGAVEGWWAPDAEGTELYDGVSTTYADRDALLAAWDPENPDHYNWDADATQRWWLDRLAADDQITHWEAFANSAPYFMTESGYVSGGFDANAEQLQPEADEAFVAYLTEVTEYLEEAHGITFDTLDPFNEPNTNYWGTQLTGGVPTGGRQEGMHVGPQRQTEVVDALYDRLAQDGTTTEAVIAAMDETNPGRFVTNWAAYSDEQRAKVEQMNVHTYGTSQRQEVRDLAKQADTSLWMSEIEGSWVTGWNPLPMENGLGLASRINDDLRELEPNAWVLWQPVEDLYNMEQPAPRGENLNWGSMFIDFDCRPYTEDGQEVWKSERRVADAGGDSSQAPECGVTVNSKYNALRNYTHFITPGDLLIPTDSTDTTAAVAEDGESVTLVHSNPAATEESVTLDLSNFGRIDGDATVTAYVTTQAPSVEDPTGNSLVAQDSVAVVGTTATVTVPAKSVTTLVVDGVGGVADGAAALQDGGAYQFVGVQSGHALSAGESGLTIQDAGAQGAAAASQVWTAQELDRSGADQPATKAFALQDSRGRYLATDGTSISYTTEAEVTSASTWFLTTTNGTTWSLVNEANARSLDVNGQSTATGASVGTYPSNGGGNQTWSIRDLTPQAVTLAVRTNPGVAPTLPATVAPEYAWGTGTEVPVTWESVEGEDWAPGLVEVAGTATDAYGSAFEVTLTVEVGELTATDPVSITVPRGISAEAVLASLPSTVPARAGASSLTFEAPVTWQSEDLADSDLASNGVVHLTGSAQTDGTTLPAQLAVIVTDPGTANIAPEAGTTATATSTENGYPVDRTRNGDRTDKGWSNWVANNKPTQDTLTYTFEETRIAGVDVYYYADGSTTSWAETMQVEYRTPQGEWVSAPGYEEAQAVENPAIGAPVVQSSWDPVTATGVRIVMDAYENTHMTVSEVEILAVSATPSDVAVLASLRADGQEVPVEEGVTDYEVTIAAEDFPTVQAFAIDADAQVTITQPTEENLGVATVVVTSPSETTLTYTLTIALEDVVEPVATFSDVPEETMFFAEIEWLASQGISTGWEMPDGSSEFRPLSPINRDAMAAFLYRMAGEPEVTLPETSPFVDVAESNQFYTEIVWLAQEGISTGWSTARGAEFRPLSPIARDAMAAFLYRYDGAENGDVEGYQPPATSAFADVSTGNQFYTEISWMAEREIAQGWDGNDGTSIFRPLNNVARDAMAAFLYRYAHLG